MKKFFKLVAVFAAVIACASCTGKGGEQPANGDTTKACCDSTKKECCDSTKAQDSVKADAATDTVKAEAAAAPSRPAPNSNDVFARRMERYTKELILTDAQQAQLAEVLTVGADRMEKYIAAQERPSVEQIQKFHKEDMAKIKKFLKKNQYEQLEKMEEEWQKRFEERVAAKAKAAEEAAKK